MIPPSKHREIPAGQGNLVYSENGRRVLIKGHWLLIECDYYHNATHNIPHYRVRLADDPRLMQANEASEDATALLAQLFNNWQP